MMEIITNPIKVASITTPLNNAVMLKYASDSFKGFFYTTKGRINNAICEKTNVIVDGNVVMLLAMDKKLEDKVIEGGLFVPSIRTNPEHCTIWEFCVSC